MNKIQDGRKKMQGEIKIQNKKSLQNKACKAHTDLPGFS